MVQKTQVELSLTICVRLYFKAIYLFIGTNCNCPQVKCTTSVQIASDFSLIFIIVEIQ